MIEFKVLAFKKQGIHCLRGIKTWWIEERISFFCTCYAQFWIDTLF